MSRHNNFLHSKAKIIMTIIESLDISKQDLQFYDRLGVSFSVEILEQFQTAG